MVIDAAQPGVADDVIVLLWPRCSEAMACHTHDRVDVLALLIPHAGLLAPDRYPAALQRSSQSMLLSASQFNPDLHGSGSREPRVTYRAAGTCRQQPKAENSQLGIDLGLK
jgi:hypothetical protein